MAQLQSASSIIDFLKSRGFTPMVGERVPLFEQRKKIFEQLGLQKQLGQFRGTATQNPALLQSLARLERDTGVKVSPTNIGDILKVGQQPKQAQQPVQQQPMFETGFLDQQTMQQIPQQQIQQQEQQIVPSQRQEQQIQQVQQLPQQQEQPAQMPSQLREAALSLFKQPSPEELSQQALQKFTGSSEFGFAQERAGMEKEKVQQQAKQTAENFIAELGSRGMGISGKRIKGLAQIESNKLANLLNIDREFAYLITKGLESSAKEIAKEAQGGSKQALEALNVLGYGINPITGGIEPTLQAKQLQRQEEQQQLQQGRFEQQEARKTEEFGVRQQQFEQTQQRLEQQFKETQERLENQFGAQQAQTKKQLELSERRVQVTEGKARVIPAGKIIVPKQLPSSSSIKKEDKSNIEKQFSLISTGLQKFQFENAKQTLSNFLSGGDLKGAQQYIDKLAFQTLPADQRNDYTMYVNVENETSNSLGKIGSFKSINYTVYKDALDKKKPFANLSRDQKWVDLTATIERAQSEFRRALFGTAVTGTEMVSAERFFINPAKDDISTIETKLKGMVNFSRSKRTIIIGIAKGQLGTQKSSNDPLGIR